MQKDRYFQHILRLEQRSGVPRRRAGYAIVCNLEWIFLPLKCGSQDRLTHGSREVGSVWEPATVLLSFRFFWIHNYCCCLKNVILVPLWNYIDRPATREHAADMPRSRFDALLALAEDDDGLVRAHQARAIGISEKGWNGSHTGSVEFRTFRQIGGPSTGKRCCGHELVTDRRMSPCLTRPPWPCMGSQT
jgi:hypothetical protein